MYIPKKYTHMRSIPTYAVKIHLFGNIPWPTYNVIIYSLLLKNFKRYFVPYLVSLPAAQRCNWNRLVRKFYNRIFTNENIKEVTPHLILSSRSRWEVLIQSLNCFFCKTLPVWQAGFDSISLTLYTLSTMF